MELADWLSRDAASTRQADDTALDIPDLPVAAVLVNTETISIPFHSTHIANLHELQALDRECQELIVAIQSNNPKFTRRYSLKQHFSEHSIWVYETSGTSVSSCDSLDGIS